MQGVRKLTRVLRAFNGAVLTGVLLAAGTSLAAMGATPKAEPGSVVIVFKDGHTQTIPLADIARIDFTAASGSAATNAKPSNLPVPSRMRFIGKWKLGDGNGSTFIVKLRDNGEATKDIGSPHGTWTYVDGEARITWDDGWHDAIRKAGTKYEKFGYAPGKSFSDKPDNVTEATSTMPEPI